MKQIIDLSGKKILVTGASSGMGRATAILCSQIGATLVVTGRDEKRLQETISLMECRERHDYYITDLSELNNIEGLIQQSVEKDKRKLDGIAYCAGISKLIPLKMSDYQKQQETMHINYYAFVEIVRHYAKNKYCTQGGSVVGISSVAALKGAKGQTIYAGTKGAMDAAVVALSKELARKKIRVNSVRPGLVKTKMLETNEYMTGVESTEDLEALEPLQLLGLGDAEDIANLIAFLLSPASKFITGQSFLIDGGGPKLDWL